MARWFVAFLPLFLVVHGCVAPQRAATPRPEESATPKTAASAASRRPAGLPPNVVILLADDLAPGWLGYEGDKVARTPNLDRLAAQGVSFSRCYVTAPQCAPSRASILTGKYPHRSGVLSNVEPRLPRNAATLPRLLKSVGYRCGLVGKWHNGDPKWPDGGFEDYWVTWINGPAGTKNTLPLIYKDGEVHEHERYMTEVLADYSIEFIKENVDRPFLLTLSFCQPHTPRDFVPGYRFEPSEMTLPVSVADNLHKKPVAQRASVTHEYFKAFGEKRLKREIAEYYSMISAMDAAIGRVLDSLAAHGLERDTLVIFASDNGVFLGQHQMMEKGAAFYEELVRTPLILKQTGVLPAGVERKAITSLVDLLPTITRRAGVEPPGDIDGVDLWPVAMGARQSVRDAAFLEYYHKLDADEPTPMLGVVTAGFKYTRYLESREEELYDLNADPHEMRNLVGVSAAIPQLRALRKRVDDYAASISPPFWTR